MPDVSLEFLLNKVRCPQDKGLVKIQIEGRAVCSSCGRPYEIKEGKIFFSKPPPDAKVAAEDDSLRDKNTWTNWRKSNFEFFEVALRDVDRRSILIDLGAGPARFREIIADFRNYIGVDFYPFELVKVVADIAEALPFGDGVADIIFMSNVLEHIPAPANLIAECYRVLKPGGLVIGTVPFLLKVHQEPYDYYRYTNFMLEKLFSDNGFRTSEVKSLGRPSDVYATATRLFFTYLFGAEKIRSDPWLRLKARIARKSTNFIFRIFAPLYTYAEPSHRFSEGYGFKAEK